MNMKKLRTTSLKVFIRLFKARMMKYHNSEDRYNKRMKSLIEFNKTAKVIKKRQPTLLRQQRL
jgi:hypothetical protein